MSTVVDALDAMKARLESVLSVPVLIGDGTGSPPPFVVVWSGTEDRQADESAAGSCGQWSAPVGVTFTARLPRTALRMASDGKQALTPDLMPALLPSSVARFLITYEESTPVDVDRAVVLPESNTNPAYTVAMFTVYTQEIS